MSLRVWLPLTKDLRNQGLDDVTVTNNGATFDANGKLGGCYSFDGNHYLQSNIQIGEGWKEITFACWVYLNEVVLTSGSWYRILGIGAHTRAHLDITSNNSLRLFVSQTGTTSGLGVLSTTIGQAGKWYHLCGVLGNNYMSIYINGLKENEKVIDSSSITYTNADYFRVGSITSGNAFSGKISDVRVYDHALSPLEVKHISQGLILHYPLNRNGWGQENLIKNNLLRKSGNANGITFSNSVLGNEYISISGTATADINQWLINLTSLTNITNTTITISTNEIISNSVRKIFLSTTKNGNWYRDVIPPLTASKYFTVILEEGETPRYLRILSQKGQIINSNLHFKLEIGDKPTPWCPNEADELYNKLEINSNIQYDTSGYCNNGVKTGNFQYDNDTPKYNVSAIFNGADNCIQIGNLYSIFSNPFSINLWFKKEVIGSKKYETLIGGASGFEMDTRNGASQTLSLYMTSTRGGNVYSPFEFNNWYMVTMVNNGTHELYYINGILTKTINKKNMPNSNYYIGAWNTPTQQNFKGNMSDVRIYCTALSAEDILSLYNNSAYIDNQGNIYGAIYEEV